MRKVPRSPSRAWLRGLRERDSVTAAESGATTKDQVVALLALAEANGGKFSVLMSRFGWKPVGAAAATGLLLR